MNLGARALGGGRCEFRVWAPRARKVFVHLLEPADGLTPLVKDEKGYHSGILEGVDPGARYRYRLVYDRLTQTIELPDPASRFQPEGVLGPSEVVDPVFPWTDGGWPGRELAQYVIYELHVGAFSQAGTFEGAIPQLDRLKDLGVTAVELMPVAQFSGRRGWGYDGVFPFAPHDAYGGPAGLKRLVDAAHQRGIAVILDAVYNHVGPEGSVLHHYGPYTNNRYKTPWGPLYNFDGADGTQVRRFFIENALYWFSEYHVDALRLDAIHQVLDLPKHSFLENLSKSVRGLSQRLGRPLFLIAESDINDVKLIQSRGERGYGLDAQWNDDFQRALHAVVTGERFGYYQDFGKVSHLERAIREGFVITGQYSAYRKKQHGASSRETPAHQFVVFDQNHDVVGNRWMGDRLGHTVSLERKKLSLGVVLLAPYIPMLFMGEEYGEKRPFHYFANFRDPRLAQRVREGRREEFAGFDWAGEPPDPGLLDTFLQSKLTDRLWERDSHRQLSDWTRELLRLRREIPALAALDKETTHVLNSLERFLFIHRWQAGSEAVLICDFSPEAPAPARPSRSSGAGGNAVGQVGWPTTKGVWRKVLDSADPRWGGAGAIAPDRVEAAKMDHIRFAPHALALFVREDAG
ncbi:MAG: malto-oligosyltrehalose trehalohydrolase [Candidatus Omnitrophica bacterium CG11_big_fil_rev_8_21_14_0_20_64_10]|nr:MAG: malto-oligosyltrehalose trehalohydrolase [Candidatus Omnitrophica bacterium CG11_big_fil_rev_8_21_14_0_20_64_10]